MEEKTCIQCGMSQSRIKKEQLICGTLSYEGELDEEWPRHKFKPYTQKELEAIRSDEEAYVKEMGEMAEAFNSPQ